MKANSITLMGIGICLLAIALFVENIFVQYPLLFSSIILNLVAIVKSIREKKEKE